MPEEKADTDYIMVATGTGIAPYRSFIRRLFTETTPFGEAYKGTAWLFLGVANSDSLLYDDEWQEVLKNYPDNFKLDYALSREATNKKGGKMYIQDKVEEYSDDIFNRLDNGAHIYFCGLKGMMPGIQGMLEEVCNNKGLSYEEWLKGLKKRGLGEALDQVGRADVRHLLEVQVVRPRQRALDRRHLRHVLRHVDLHV